MRCRNKVHFDTEDHAREVLLAKILEGPGERGYSPVNVAECVCGEGGYVLTSKSAKVYAKGKGKNKSYGYAHRSRKRKGKRR